ncbi:MAG TPA: AtpZ/AtpI family protein [Clostridia bacterium]|nr:AtpZ/AtpI family protein [Clostridia bacterium]
MKSQDYWRYAKYANFAVSFGVTMAASLFLGFYGGRWLDRKLGTEPLCLVLGLLGGAAMAFYSMLKELQALDKFNPPKDARKDD